MVTPTHQGDQLIQNCDIFLMNNVCKSESWSLSLDKIILKMKLILDSVILLSFVVRKISGFLASNQSSVTDPQLLVSWQPDSHHPIQQLGMDVATCASFFQPHFSSYFSQAVHKAQEQLIWNSQQEGKKTLIYSFNSEGSIQSWNYYQQYTLLVTQLPA